MNSQALTDWDQEVAAVSVLLRDHGRFLALGLVEDHFTKGSHIAVLQASVRLYAAGEPVTLGSVALELQRAGIDGLVGKEPGLLELRRGIPGKVLDPARLRKLASLRAVKDRLAEAAVLAGQEDLPGALAKVDEAMQFGKGSSTVIGLRELVECALEQSGADARARSRIIYPGSDSLEQAIGGFREGGMYVLGALSNVGKSFLCQSWMMRCCSRGLTVGWVSLEDPQLTTGSRALGMLSALEPRAIELGDVFRSAQGVAAVGKGHALATEWDRRFLYTDLTGQTEIDVCAAMSVMAAQGARVVVVDYVGVITASKEQENRRNDVRWIAIRLKAHAKRLGIALLLISQLTMPRDDDGVAKEPSKYALRESGDLTNAAEAIILAWREEESDDAPVNVKVAKSKSGGVGKCWTVKRNESTQVFDDLTEASFRPRPQKKTRGGFGV